MKRLSGGLLAIFVALLLPSLAYAQAGVDQPFAGMWQLSPPATDASVYFLGQLFGSVGGILGSAGSQVMGHIFKAFNYGLIVVAGSMLVYTVVMSVLNTAHDGQFMGQEKKGAWVILRAVGGISFLVPQASGYCFAQIFVMWAVVQGVGLADIAWGRVLDYLEAGGSVYVQSSVDTIPTLKDGVGDTLSQVMQSGLCLQGVAQAVKQSYDQKVADARAQGAPRPTNTPFAWGAYVDDPGAGSTSTLRFGVSDPKSRLASICGSYTLGGSDSGDVVSPQNMQYIKAAGLELYNGQLSLATLLSDPNLPELSCKDKYHATCDTLANTVANLTMNLQNLLQPVLTDKASDTKDQASDALEEARERGWIMGGSYYYTFSALEKKAHGLDDLSNYIQIKPTAKFPDYGNIKTAVRNETGYDINTKPISDVTNAFVGNFQYLVNGKDGEASKVNAILEARAAYADQSLSGDITSTTGNKNSKAFKKTKRGLTAIAIVGGGPIGAVVLPRMFNRIIELVDKWNTAFASGDQSQQDPILKVSQFGRDMVSTGVKIWMQSSAAIFGISVGMSILTSITGIGAGLASSAKMFTPIVIAVVVALVVNGVVLSVYIPLIPFLLFFFTAVGWMMSVVEAIVAAPLVALGVTHPEGHDLLGKSEQSLMLLLSVFVKPIAMLIGFFAAMIISRVGIEMLNMGIGNALSIKGGYGKYDIFSTMGFMMIYTLILIGLINFSFALIHLLPDKIMRWLGTSPDSFGGEQQMAAIKGGLSSGMQKIAKSGADASITSADYADAAGKQANNAKSGDGDKSSGSDGGKGGDSGGGGGSSSPPPEAAAA